MIRMIVRHPVKDYAVWRKGYDAAKSMRAEMGVTGAAVYQSVDDPNDITVTHDFDNEKAAKAFAGSDFLKEKMRELGVSGTAVVWFVRHV